MPDNLDKLKVNNPDLKDILHFFFRIDLKIVVVLKVSNTFLILRYILHLMF